MTDPRTALTYINEALDALSIEMWKGRDLDRMVRAPAIEATIAEDLDRIDSAIGVKGQSMFAALAENIRQAVIALHAAKAELEKLI